MPGPDGGPGVFQAEMIFSLANIIQEIWRIPPVIVNFYAKYSEIVIDKRRKIV
jgi:hypothetical protein